jgi:hypothetical protein
LFATAKDCRCAIVLDSKWAAREANFLDDSGQRQAIDDIYYDDQNNGAIATVFGANLATAKYLSIDNFRIISAFLKKR